MRSSLRAEIAGVTVYFDSIKALDNVKLKINRNEFVGLIGPNGSGKTTLLRCIYKYVKPKLGAIYIEGRDLKDIGLKELSRLIASVPTEIPERFNLTVSDIVLMGRTPFISSWWEDRKSLIKAEEAMRILDVLHLSNRKFSELSSGEKQRVLIAKALAQEPKMLLVDEPTAHLDIKHQLSIMELLKRIARSNISVLAATHDLNLAARYCDKLVLLKKGRVISVGAPEEVLSPELIAEVYEIKVKVRRDDKDGRIFVIPLSPR